MGFNRRGMFSDGTSRMYGNSEQEGYIGLEGPRDPALAVLFVRDNEGRIPGVVVNFSTHPTAIENDEVYSADIPAEVRGAIKRLLGPDTVVVYLTRPAGNTSPVCIDPYDPQRPWSGEDGVRRSGLYLGGETARLIAAADAPIQPFVLRWARTTLNVPVRPWPAPGEPTFPLTLERPEVWPTSEHYYQRARSEWEQRLREEPEAAVRLNVARLGDTVLCTNPNELFVEFGLAIRERSPARTTLLAELTDGYAGYVCTPLAYRRGGYETWTAPSSKLALDTGQRIVEATDEMMRKVFRE
jgi:hypothetical protein